MSLAKNLLQKESQLPTLLEQFHSFIAPYKAAFDCSYKLLLIVVTLPVTKASCERSFSKMKLVKTFLRHSTTSERLSNIVLLSFEKVRAEKIYLDQGSSTWGLRPHAVVVNHFWRGVQYIFYVCRCFTFA